MTQLQTQNSLSVLLFVESRYRLNRKRIRKTVADTLKINAVAGDIEVSIAIVGDRKMRDLSKKFKGEDKTRNILSFPLSEGEPTVMPADKLRLGDIVISFPVAVKEAGEENMLVEDRINMLVEHGLLHLLGIHHE